jgi:putative peptidoglycan lipid II flippase
VVAAGTLLSRVLGLGRDSVLAAMFSRGATDAFMVAFTIPNTLRQLLAEGAVQTAVLPVLAKTREAEGEAAARRYFAAARGVSLLVLTAVSALGVVFAEQLVTLFAGGTRADPSQFRSTVELTRWLFPYIFFMGTTALGAAALNASQRFVVTAFAPALLNVACIACALALPAWLTARGRDPVLAMGFGVLLGGALQAAAQWPSLRATGFLERPRFDFRHPGVRETFRRMTPVLFGLGVYLVDVALSRHFLSELGVGAQTYFGFALRLCDFPQGIFVMAIQTAALPSLSALAARNDKESLEATFAFGVRLTLFVGIAATVLFVAIPQPIVALLFQRGEFDAHAAHETARALVAQGAGIWTVAVVRQLLAVYYALGDTRRPVLVSLLDLGVFVGLALGLRGWLGHVGIGVAVAGSSAVQMLLLAAGLRRHLSGSRAGEIARSAGRTLLAAVAAGAAAAGAASLLAGVTEGGFLATLAPGVGGTAVFGAVFLGAAHALGSDELRTIRSALERRRGARA